MTYTLKIKERTKERQTDTRKKRKKDRQKMRYNTISLLILSVGTVMQLNTLGSVRFFDSKLQLEFCFRFKMMRDA